MKLEKITLDKNEYIYSELGGYNFSEDSIALFNFLKESPFLKKSGVKFLEIGSGIGIISILLGKFLLENGQDFQGVGIEIQERASKIFAKNLMEHNLGDKIHSHCKDIKEWPKGNTYDLIFSNPPYFKLESGKTSVKESLSISRHEVKLTLEELFKESKRLLKPQGSFMLVHRSDRLQEIITIASSYNLKLIRMKGLESRGKRGIKENKNVLLEFYKGKSGKFLWELEGD